MASVPADRGYHLLGMALGPRDLDAAAAQLKEHQVGLQAPDG